MTNININNIHPEPPHCITEPKLVVLTRSFSECSEICQACISPQSGWVLNSKTTSLQIPTPSLPSDFMPSLLVRVAILIFAERIYHPGTINSQSH